MDTRTRRTDLEQAEYKAPGYLTPVLFPLLPRAMRQGTLYYNDIIADIAAQTGRVAGAAPTENTIADAKTTYNLENDEFIDREKVPDGDIAGLGGLMAAQMKAARKGKRAVGEAIEDLTVANILANGSVSYVDIGSSLIAAVSLGYDVLSDYAEGEIALCLSSRLFNLIKRYDEVITRMQFTGILPGSVRDVRGISAAQLASVLNVDRILVGPNGAWYDQSATYQDRAALVVLPDAAPGPDEVIQVGRTLWFSADGNTPAAESMFEVHTWYSEDKVSEMCDVRAYAEQHVLNTELIYGLDGIDSDLLPS